MKAIAIWVACGLWFVGVVVALSAVWAYKTTDNGSPGAPARWPSASAIHIAPDRANVILFAHPQCPCTKATMTELSHLAEELDGRAAIHVILVRPPGTDAGFEEGAIADRAKQLKGADVAIDQDGVEATRFRAKTSGSVVVYGSHGELLFTGGITSARGHEGRAPGFDRILALVAGKSSERHDAPTFGCALQDKVTAVQ